MIKRTIVLTMIVIITSLLNSCEDHGACKGYANWGDNVRLNTVTHGYYVKDRRTSLCFLKSPNSRGFTYANVPCIEVVEEEILLAQETCNVN